MKAKLLLPLLIIIFASCASHDKQNRHYYTQIAPKHLKKDVRYVQKQLQKMHPDLYWYISKEQLNNKFDSLKNKLTAQLTPNKFLMKLSRLLPSFHKEKRIIIMLNLP